MSDELLFADLKVIDMRWIAAPVAAPFWRTLARR